MATGENIAQNILYAYLYKYISSGTFNAAMEGNYILEVSYFSSQIASNRKQYIIHIRPPRYIFENTLTTKTFALFFISFGI